MEILDKNIAFSRISGYNYYELSGTVNEIIYGNHMVDGTAVEIRFSIAEKTLDKWRSMIEYPIDLTNFVWPIDIITIEQHDRGEQNALVFRKRAFPKLEPLKKILYQESLLDWHKEHTQNIIRNLLHVFCMLDREGYAYHILDIERIFYNSNNDEVLFDFNMGIAKHNCNITQKEVIYMEERKGIEFMAPWHEIGKNNNVDLISQYYSITALLFRLMVGRMPYQGRLMDGYDIMNHLRDNDPDLHISMFREYFEHPIFIFEKNERNAIGRTLDEEKIIARWEQLPRHIQKMFVEVLCEENVAKRKRMRKYYTPFQWLEALEDVL